MSPKSYHITCVTPPANSHVLYQVSSTTYFTSTSRCVMLSHFLVWLGDVTSNFPGLISLCIISSLHSLPFHPQVCLFPFYHLSFHCCSLHLTLRTPFVNVPPYSIHCLSHLSLSIIQFPFSSDSLGSSLPSASPVLSLLLSSTQCGCKNPDSLKTWRPVTLGWHSTPTPNKWMEIYTKIVSVYVCVCVGWLPLMWM